MPDLYALMKVSPELEAIIGVKEAKWHEVLELVWAYVKKNNLQDPENKLVVMCDDKLKKVSGKTKFHPFKMYTFLNNHMSVNEQS